MSGEALVRQHVFGAADLGGAGRQHQILRVDGVDDIVRRQSLGEQRRRCRGPPKRRAACRRTATVWRRPEWSPDRGRRKFIAASNTACSDIVGLERPSWMTGMLDAEYLMTSGGRMPGGICRSCACSIATTCAMAVGMLALRLKENLDDRNAGQRLGFDVLDIVDGGGQAALVDRRDALAHFLRRQPGIVPDDADRPEC